MAEPKMPKNDQELRALSDADLEGLRAGLALQQDQIRLARKLLALEAERRARLPKVKG